MFFQLAASPFFGLSVDPFKSSCPSFSARDIILYTVLIFKENISAISLQICLYNNLKREIVYFLKLVFLAVLYWNIRTLVALKTITLLLKSYLLLSHSISFVKNPKCPTFLWYNGIFLLFFFYYPHSICKDIFDTFYTV